MRELNSDYQSKLGANGSVIADQAAHQRLLEGMVYGKPVSELTGTAFAQQQQAVNEMNAAFQGKQTTINEGFDYLFGLNEKINLAQDYLIARNQILAESRQPITDVIELEGSGVLSKAIDFKVVKNSVHPDLRFRRANFAVNVFATIPEKKDIKVYRIIDYRIIAFTSLDTVAFSFEGRIFNRTISYYPLIEIPDNEVSRRWVCTLNVVSFPVETLPAFQSRLDALDAEYRGKGLNV